jgi:hypothetical protein
MNIEQFKNPGDESEPKDRVDQQKASNLAHKELFSSEEIAEAKRRSKLEVGGRTTQEVLERLSKLESR